MTELNNIINDIFINRKNIFFHGAGGTGKCLSPNQGVMMFDGSTRAAKNIKLNDVLMGDDSSPRNVINICSGIDKMYKIILENGDSFIANSEHILVLKSSSFDSRLDMSANVNNILTLPINIYIDQPEEWKSTMRLYKTAISFDTQKLDIDPYFLGLWLGPEVIRQPEILNWVNYYSNNYGMDIDDDNILFKKINKMGIFKKRHIPDIFLKNSKNNRLKLLAGFIDNNSNSYKYKYSNTSITITQSDNKILKGLIFLIKSLGFTIEILKFNNKGNVFSKIKISGNHLNIIPLLNNSQPKFKCTHYEHLNETFKVHYIGIGNYNGFTVDNNNRFVLDNFIVTHNSWNIRYIKDEALKRNLNCAVTATTGVAALNIGGSTFHKYAGIGIAKGSKENILDKVKKSYTTVKNITNTDILIIDEISMFGGGLLDKMDYLFRHIRKNPDKPFGGLQIIVSGDLLQLPPINDIWCFEANTWDSLNLKVYNFNKSYRFDDKEYHKMLLRIREGEHTKDDIKLLKSKIYKEIPKMEIKPTILYPKKVNVANYNIEQLKLLPSKMIIFTAIDNFIPLTSKEIKIEFYNKTLNDAASKTLPIKIGAQVMLTINLDVEGGLINGSRGIVVDIANTINNLDRSVTVKFINGRQLKLTNHTWEMNDNYAKVNRTQIPLILAWSLTIHKTQSATLDRVICDLGHDIFADGQAYVALSRVRNAEGLYFINFLEKSIKVNSKAKEYNQLIS